MSQNNIRNDNSENKEIADLPSAYDPKSVESRIYSEWLSRGFFNPDSSYPKPRTLNPKPYVILLPPPNITGSLHMGHTLNAVTSDILIRYHRMKGFKTAWLPGIDHAGIAAQNVVEKQLRKENISRFTLGREKFVDKVWEWKNKSGTIILDQLKSLGASADWSRTRFTMDPAYSEDVLKAFVHYHKKGLIYRGKRMVSWCVRCGTGLSDLEIEHKEETSKLYFIRYPLTGRENQNKTEFITVATTRPETMLGDAAVAVNPKDKRYKNLIGQKVLLPIVNREIPIIADDAIDMTFGTGAVKVTPAHDALDNEIGARHNLPNYEIISERGKMQNTGQFGSASTAASAGQAGSATNNLSSRAESRDNNTCDGLKIAECREKVVAELQEQNLIEKIEDFKHNVAKCYRCDTTLEPLLSNQWFLKMGELAKKTIKTVKSGKTKIVPKNFEKPFFEWLKNIKDWCISRQIWWGHQLPVYFCQNKNKQEAITNNQLPITNKNKNSKIGNWKLEIGNSSPEQFVVSLGEPSICPFCKQCKMERSGDVLDTWFSSALWPFAGLSEADLKSFYPSDVLITARDIINLWVGRMIFSGLEFMKNKTPFSEALIHATILAKDGRRMSKSLGTGVDPMDYVKAHGADATRFGVIWQAMGGQDIRWDENAVLAGRKFANKIWNAARFVLGRSSSPSINSGTNYSPSKAAPAASRGHINVKPKTEADKKILSELKKTKKLVETNIKKYEFGHALHAAYDFFWHEFCDIYLEASKAQQDKDDYSLSLSKGNLGLTENTNQILEHVLFESLKILHPFMPHLTEEIYQKLPIENKNWLIIEKW